MRKKLNIFLRIGITAILILVQIALFSLLLIYFVHWGPIVTVAMYFFSLLVLLFIIRNDDEAGYKIGWIIVVFFLSPAGGLLYLLFGGNRPARKLHYAINREHQANSQLLKQNAEVYHGVETANKRTAGLVSYINRTAHAPAYENTFTKYYSFGQDMFADMLVELKKAQHFIFMEYFIIDAGVMWDSLLDVLTEKAKAGVDVRLLYDDFGSLVMLPSNFARQMEARGIKCIAFNPLVPSMALSMNNRDHRKIMVVDGHTAFSGGINIADEYINAISPRGIWKDTGIMLQGDAVWSYTLMFLEIWNAVAKDRISQEQLANYRPTAYTDERWETDGYVQPYGDSPLDDHTIGEDVYIDILNQAEHYVHIFTPYLIISEKMKATLVLAAQRGVDVCITTPGVPDKKIVYAQTRSYYKGLLQGGVRIFEYTPGFLHAKSFVCDDRIAVVGTINLDYRSLYLHFECGTLLIGSSCVAELKKDTAATLKQCREVSLQDCNRGFWRELFDSIVRIIAPLM